ncbi:hypothetical protein ABB37_07236 [Leptomonas pyrrhocoris]|uniref:Uncharacterized protein n=1 Tax=Leptomonas pyrrhocoris TaxID=157538 RepID=A0A0M9FWE9_LEPPY|nr:hypothetical protein ABB37_07236 [Leptomonas pyrrhocoris]XP_015655803.1 hypothetical protein ABB37_07236 [Leptomonas pyrrhocoris]KPA77363.1 hypothetical protein ABB37_07236 [Leptomonas pyrrhocoris]KPA77364.1 hypothetical protein ABB37_07236 [Leptomonas pyrrhocoris]|eukprot:XP_015655802.1 hypothetical protein ABB37_07236 [Leptomonas pyrrhocoris]
MSRTTAPPVRFAERHIAHINKCYCVAPYVSRREPQRAMFLVAAEQNDPCFVYDIDGKPVEKVWDGPGGVMSMVQLPEMDGRTVLSTQRFYGFDNSEDARLVVAKALTMEPAEDAVERCAWRRFVVADMPFLHRFDVVPGRGSGNTDRYIIACTLKRNQREPGDWSQPGQVLAARLPNDFDDLLPTNWREMPEWSPLQTPLSWKVLREGCFRNHGYHRHTDPVSGEVNCVIGCEAGTFLFRPPTVGSDEWDSTQLTADPASDAALVDLDRDGAEELLVIAPFHGDTIMVYHKNEEGAYQRVYTHPTKLPFLHAIWGGVLDDVPCVVVGHRSGDRDLFLFSYSKSKGYHVDRVAHGFGPANVINVKHTKEGESRVRESIVCCNRETDTVTVYDVVPKNA